MAKQVRILANSRIPASRISGDRVRVMQDASRVRAWQKDRQLNHAPLDPSANPATRSTTLSAVKEQIPQAHPKARAVMLSFANSNALMMLNNFVSLVSRALADSSVNQKPPLVILNLDAGTHEMCSDLQLLLPRRSLVLACVEPNTSLALFTPPGKPPLDTTDFRALQRGKVLALRFLLQFLRTDVLLLDIDVALIHNPIPYMQAAADKGQLLVAQDGHRGGSYNTGVVLATAQPGTDNLLAAWHSKALTTESDTPEQHALIWFLKFGRRGHEIAAASWRDLLHRPRCNDETKAPSSGGFQLRKTFADMRNLTKGPMLIHYSGMTRSTDKIGCMASDDNWHPFPTLRAAPSSKRSARQSALPSGDSALPCIVFDSGPRKIWNDGRRCGSCCGADGDRTSEMCTGSSWDGGIITTLEDVESRCASDSKCVGFYQGVRASCRGQQRHACALFRPVSSWQGSLFIGGWTVQAKRLVGAPHAPPPFKMVARENGTCVKLT